MDVQPWHVLVLLIPLVGVAMLTTIAYLGGWGFDHGRRRPRRTTTGAGRVRPDA